MRNITEIIAKAPGKVILFGEHAVVYGKPAIAMAIDFGTQCIINPGSQPGILLNLFNETQNYEMKMKTDISPQITPKYRQFQEGFAVIQKYVRSKITSISIQIVQQLWYGVGLGSSASSSAAFVWALNGFFNLRLDKDIINHITYQMEKIVHKTPSGIDNSTSVFGQGIHFHNGTPVKFQFPYELPLLIVHSGKIHDTSKAIQKVQLFKKKQPIILEKMWDTVENITNDAINAIKQNDLVQIGELMNKNQQILEKLGLSTPEIDSILQIAHEYHSFGAKITGAGLGGCVIVLSPLEKLKFLSEKYSHQGFANRIIQIDQDGVCFE